MTLISQLTPLQLKRYRSLAALSIQRVAEALARGGIPALTGIACYDCNMRPAALYDHRDYYKPLEVEPVCHSCNKKRGPASATIERLKLEITNDTSTHDSVMELRIRNLDDKTHEAATLAAARAKKSLNQYVIDALRGAVLRSAQKDKIVAAILEESAKP